MLQHQLDERPLVIQLLGQLLHVAIHHWLLDLEIRQERPRRDEPRLPDPRIPIIFESTHTSQVYCNNTSVTMGLT